MRKGFQRARSGRNRQALPRRVFLLGFGAAVAIAAAPAISLAESAWLDVTKAPDRRVAIGVGKYPTVPAAHVGSPPSEVVAFDLELSGWFDPKLAGSLPPRDLSDWERRGAELVVELEMEATLLVGRVRDVGTGEVIFEERYPGSWNTLRKRIHEFCDAVVTKITSQPGLARSSILCERDTGDGNGKHIVLMGIDGHGVRALTGESALELTPRFSPDGNRAIYTSFASRYPDVYVHDLTVGSRERVAHYDGLNAHGDLSPDGSTLVLVLSAPGNPEIYSKLLSSGRIRRLTDHRGTDTSPVWSPDGRRIAFVSDRSGTPQVYLMSADGDQVDRLTERGNYNTAPDWSPDGTQIAYCALRPDGYQIQVIELSSRKVTTITELGGCEDPSFSPDGRSVLYSRKAGGRTDLYITPLNERRALRVSQGSGRFTAPDWSPHDVSKK